MTTGWWTVVLMGVGGTLTWASFIAKLLWDFRGKWDETNAKLADLAGRDLLIEQKLDLHLAWHDRSCQNWPRRREGR